MTNNKDKKEAGNTDDNGKNFKKNHENGWSREESTDVRSRPLLGDEDSDVVVEATPHTDPSRVGTESITRPNIKPSPPRLDVEERWAEPMRTISSADHANTARADDLATLWRAFDRSLGKPLDRPERLRIDQTLGLSSVEVTTLRKILGWLRQIDTVVGPTGLAPMSPSATSMLIAVERGRIVLTRPLLAHLRSTSRTGESEAQSLARWLCVMARHHRALPWELVAHEVEPFPAGAPRLTPLELLLACRPTDQSAPADLACTFAAQTDALADETWIFGRGEDGGLDGLILARSPEQCALHNVYEAASQCEELLTNVEALRLLGSQHTICLGILPDALWFSVCSRRAISLQRAPLRSMGLVLSRINALEQSP